MSATTVKGAVCEAVHDTLGKGRFTVEEIAETVIADNPDLIRAETDRLITVRLREIIKCVLREVMEEEMDQDTLPGLRLPVAIMVRRFDGELYYVSSMAARWEELESGYRERIQNKARVDAKVKKYKDTMDRLEPIMKRHPELTVADALRIEQAA